MSSRRKYKCPGAYVVLTCVVRDASKTCIKVDQLDTPSTTRTETIAMGVTEHLIGVSMLLPLEGRVELRRGGAQRCKSGGSSPALVVAVLLWCT